MVWCPRQDLNLHLGTRLAPEASASASFALADVTQEEFIAGGMLAGKTYNNISSELKRFNYRRLE